MVAGRVSRPLCHDGRVDLATLEYLRTPAGRELLGTVSATYDGDNALSVSTALRASYEPGVIAAALSQVALRRHGAAKFGDDAAVLLLTRAGLEQATHQLVAAHRALRVTRSGARRVLELGCGIGADLIALCRAGLEVRAVERDPLTAQIAAANLEALGLEGRVGVGAAEDQDRSWPDIVYADPARRSARGRIRSPDRYSPPWRFVESLLEADAVVKAAPGLSHERIPVGVEAEWVSLDGQLREVSLSSGRAVTARRRATVLKTRGRPETATDADDPGQADVRPPGRFVHDPDDAVTRAHLVTVVAAEVRGWLLDEHIAYVSSDEPGDGRLAHGFEVLDVLPFRERSLRAALRARDVGALTIKTRGVMVTPEALRSRLSLTGSRAATIIVTRTPSGALALLVRRLSSAADARREP